MKTYCSSWSFEHLHAMNTTIILFSRTMSVSCVWLLILHCSGRWNLMSKEVRLICGVGGNICSSDIRVPTGSLHCREWKKIVIITWHLGSKLNSIPQDFWCFWNLTLAEIASEVDVVTCWLHPYIHESVLAPTPKFMNFEGMWGMALLPDGCSPRPDGILGQFQEEIKSLFLFTSGHMLRSVEYPDEYHAQALSLIFADSVRADQNKPMETCTSSRWKCYYLPRALSAS